MAWKRNDDDLLILSDDSDSWTDFVLDDTVINDNKNSSESEDLISFDTDLANFWNDEIKIENNETDNSPQNDLNNETNFSFWMEDSIDEQTVETNNDTNKKDDNLAFWETISEDVKATSVWSMTDILDETISKFSKREELIWNDIKSRENYVLSLKSEISELELKVSSENEEISKLNTEKQAIVKNRKALEKMKSDMNTATVVK